MAFIPNSAGPRTIRELFHWAWGELKRVGAEVGDEGGSTPPDPVPDPGHQHWHDNLINVTEDQHHPKVHTHVFFQLDQPTNEESFEGDWWVVTDNISPSTTGFP